MECIHGMMVNLIKEKEFLIMHFKQVQAENTHLRQRIDQQHLPVVSYTVCALDLDNPFQLHGDYVQRCLQE